jgi:L-lactate dehydrogenase complex protein LldG
VDTSSARAAIFARIRRAQGRSEQVSAQETEAVRDYLYNHPAGPRPNVGIDLLLRFREQAVRMFDTLDHVDAIEDVPAAVSRYLDHAGITRTAIGWETLRDLPWSEAGVHFTARPPVNEDMVGITGCFCAVAETGTLMLLSGPGTYASASLLPETHIAVLDAGRIVASMEDAFALARAERGELPRATNFISGPSRTADIEQTIVLGAHGPYRVHVVIVGKIGHLATPV